MDTLTKIKYRCCEAGAMGVELELQNMFRGTIHTHTRWILKKPNMVTLQDGVATLDFGEDTNLIQLFVGGKCNEPTPVTDDEFTSAVIYMMGMGD